MLKQVSEGKTEFFKKIQNGIINSSLVTEDICNVEICELTSFPGEAGASKLNIICIYQSVLLELCSVKYTCSWKV